METEAALKLAQEFKIKIEQRDKRIAELTALAEHLKRERNGYRAMFILAQQDRDCAI